MRWPSRPERAAVHQYAEYRHGVLRAGVVEHPYTYRGADQRRDQRAHFTDPGRLRLLNHAAADPRHRPWLRLFAVRAGSRRAGLRRAADGDQHHVRRHYANAGHGVPDLLISGQRAAAGRQNRSRQGQGAGVPLNALFSTLQTYLGSSYINDFNRYGRTGR